MKTSFEADESGTVVIKQVCLLNSKNVRFYVVHGSFDNTVKAIKCLGAVKL